MRSVIFLLAQPPLAVAGQDEVQHPGWAPELSCQLPPVVVSGVESKSLLNLLAARYQDCDRGPFTGESQDHISVYEVTAAPAG
jgi:hypothetical protein